MYNKYCSNCGYENEPEALFCEECGTTLDEYSDSENRAEADESPEASEEIEDPRYRGSRLLKHRYKIIKVYNFAGKSYTYLATDITVDKPVMIMETEDPFEDDEAGAAALIRFQDTARTFMKFNHRGIPRLLDYFEEDKKFYSVRQYIEGKNMNDLMKTRRFRPFDETIVLNWTNQLLDILVYFHSQNNPYLYKNFKPANILIDNQDKIYFVDFDINRMFETAADDGEPSGPFEAPEVSQNNADVRSGIFSVGMIIRYLLTGLNPEDSKNFKPFEKIRDINPEIPIWLDKMTGKMINPDPALRYDNAPQVMQEIINNTREEKYKALRTDFARNYSGTNADQIMPPGVQTIILPEEEKKRKGMSGCCIGCAVLSLIFLVSVLLLYYAYEPVMMSEYHKTMAKNYVAEKNHLEAETELEEALKYKKEADTYYLLGTALFEQEKYEKALEAYRECINLDYDYHDKVDTNIINSYLYLGEASAATGENIKATAYLDEALKAGSRSRYLKESGVFLRRGRSFIDGYDYNRALFNYNLVLRLFPNDVDAYIGRAICYEKMEHRKKAVEDLEEALKRGASLSTKDKELLKPLAEFYTDRSIYYLNEKDVSNALTALNNAVTIDPNNARAWYYYGMAYLFDENTNDATVAFTRTLKASPGSGWARKAEEKILQIRKISYNPKPVYTPSPAYSPAAVPSATPSEAPYKKLPTYHVHGGTSGLYVAENEKGTFMLLSGANLMQKERYHGEKAGEMLRLYTDRFGTVSHNDYRIKPLEKFKVAQISEQRKTTRSGSYISGPARITFSRAGGSSIMIEDNSLGRTLKQGTTVLGTVEENVLNLYLPEFNYQQRKFSIKGIGGIY